LRIDSGHYRDGEGELVPDVEDGDLVDEVDAVRWIDVQFDETARRQFSNLISWKKNRFVNYKQQMDCGISWF